MDLENKQYQQVSSQNENSYEIKNYYVVDKHMYLILCLPFLYFLFMFILWIQLSFLLDCGLHINFWIGMLYLIILNFVFAIIINIKYKISNKNEYILFLFSLLWTIGGIYINTSVYNECRNDTSILSTFIIFLLSSFMFTVVIINNKVN